jgi:hypothetical protein
MPPNAVLPFIFSPPTTSGSTSRHIRLHNSPTVLECTVGKQSGPVDSLNGDLQILGHFGTNGRTADVVVQGGPDGLVARVVGNRTDRQVVRQCSHSRAA